jgi:hypothetical protein
MVDWLPVAGVTGHHGGIGSNCYEYEIYIVYGLAYPGSDRCGLVLGGDGLYPSSRCR